MDRYIIKKDNVFVVVDCDIAPEIREKFDEKIILDNRNLSPHASAELYGGRVQIKSVNGRKRFYIDGIQLKKILQYSDDNSFYIDDVYSFGEIVAYLNQIENLGIDSFLENYKETIKNTRKELGEYATQLEQDLAIKENSEKRGILDSIRKIQAFIIAILFALCVNMNAGLDNYAYTEAYEHIVNTYL